MLGKIVSFLKNRRIRWYEPKRAALHEQCPCCDYLSLPERGADLICPICFWEDDGQDLDNVDVPSGPNHAITLRQGRNNFHSKPRYPARYAGANPAMTTEMHQHP